MRFRIDKVDGVSIPPRQTGNRVKQAKRNRRFRAGIQEAIMELDKEGQSFKVYGLEAYNVRSFINSFMNSFEFNEFRSFNVVTREMNPDGEDPFVQVWRVEY